MLLSGSRRPRKAGTGEEQNQQAGDAAQAALVPKKESGHLGAGTRRAQSKPMLQRTSHLRKSCVAEPRHFSANEASSSEVGEG